MLASYPRVLEAQRKLYELQVEYIGALENVWTNGIALEGYLLTDGLEAPARPGEVDRPVREYPLPSAPCRPASPCCNPEPRPFSGQARNVAVAFLGRPAQFAGCGPRRHRPRVASAKH